MRCREGHCFERGSIASWLARCGTCPRGEHKLTVEELQDHKELSNEELSNEIAAFLIHRMTDSLKTMDEDIYDF